MNTSRKKTLKILLILLPLALGTVGLIRAGSSPVNALFKSVTMYALNFGDDPENWMVQLARWLAPAATASGVIMFFASAEQRIRARAVYYLGNSTAVYGDERLAESLGKSGCLTVAVRGDTDQLLPARRYLLCFDEENENISFYFRYREQLKKRDVYLRSSSFNTESAGTANLHLFCPEETGARLYWKQANMYQQYCSSGNGMKIAIIGFGKLGEELLKWGLQNNIFSPYQDISYHIYGESGNFSKTHWELGQIQDPVIFHEEAWYEDLDTLSRADRIIITETENQKQLIQKLLFAVSERSIDVMTEDAEWLTILDEKSRVHVFEWKKEAMKAENIFDEGTLTRAKAINLRYAHLYKGVEETEKNREKEWACLNSFTRYSNISAADYHEIRLQMVNHWGEGPSFENLSREHLELLAELEHIRWCRFHYLNNWTYGEKTDGRAKDPEKRTHSDLIPYALLSEEAKEKDRENVRVMLELKT